MSLKQQKIQLNENFLIFKIRCSLWFRSRFICIWKKTNKINM